MNQYPLFTADLQARHDRLIVKAADFEKSVADYTTAQRNFELFVEAQYRLGVSGNDLSPSAEGCEHGGSDEPHLTTLGLTAWLDLLESSILTHCAVSTAQLAAQMGVLADAIGDGVDIHPQVICRLARDCKGALELRGNG